MEKVSFREILFLLEMSRDLQMLFAAIAHLVEGISLETKVPDLL
jgi:predicted ATP-dependent endonuclease of OLD family